MHACQQSSAAPIQCIIALLSPRSTYGWKSIGAAALLLSLHAATGKFSLLLAAFQRHFLPCHSITSPRMLLAGGALHAA